MSATFQASTAILLTIGLVSIVFTTEKFSGFAHQLNLFGSQDPQVLLLKILLLSFIFLGAFFCNSLAIRSLIHAGFIINLPPEKAGTHLDASMELERGALFYFCGLRFYYLSIPLALWLFGPAWMLGGAILLVALLRWLD
jgi:uncharacterized membrane protein